MESFPPGEQQRNEMISIKIKGSNEAAFSMTISPTALVSELKAKILEEQKDSSATASSLRLIFAGRVLKDEETLDKYKVLDGNT